MPVGFVMTYGDSVNTVKDVPDSFKEWVKENEGRIEAAEKKGTAPYFINDNKATVDGILGKKQSVKVESSIVGKDAAGNPITHEQWYGTSPAGKKPTESQDAIKAAKAEYDSLPDKEWHKDKFYEATGGFLVTHVLKDKDNLALKGIAAEVQACSILSNSGKKVMRLPENVFDDIDNITIDGIKYRELLKFKEGSKVPRGYPDAYFDSQTWDFKTSEFAKVDSVRKLIKDGRKADNVIFIVNEESDIEIIKHALKSEKGSRAKNGTWKELPNVYYLKNGKLESIWIK